MAQTECNVRVLGQNKFDSSIDSVKYAMILSIDKRKPDPMVSDQVRHKHGSATTCGVKKTRNVQSELCVISKFALCKEEEQFAVFKRRLTSDFIFCCLDACGI